MTSKADSYPTSVLPSLTEVKTGRLSPQNLEIAIRSLYHDGLVVVEDLIEHNRLDTLNRQMVQDAYTLQTRQDQSPFNYNRGNIQQVSSSFRTCFCVARGLEIPETLRDTRIVSRPFDFPDTCLRGSFAGCAAGKGIL